MSEQEDVAPSISPSAKEISDGPIPVLTPKCCAERSEVAFGYFLCPPLHKIGILRLLFDFSRWSVYSYRISVYIVIKNRVPDVA